MNSAFRFLLFSLFTGYAFTMPADGEKEKSAGFNLRQTLNNFHDPFLSTLVSNEKLRGGDEGIKSVIRSADNLDQLAQFYLQTISSNPNAAKVLDPSSNIEEDMMEQPPKKLTLGPAFK
jgi:hypothetical protein